MTSFNVMHAHTHSMVQKRPPIRRNFICSIGTTVAESP